MNSQIAHVVVDDPGRGRRLSNEARKDLSSRLRQAGRSEASCVVVAVHGDAWDHAPDVRSYSRDQFSQPVVAGELHALVLQVFAVEVPVVAHLDGAVSGLGLGLAMAADLRVAGPRTSLSLGRPADAAALLSGASWLLQRAVGTGGHARLAWTGDVVSARSAAQAGLLDRVVDDPEEATGYVQELAAELACVPHSTASAIKRSLIGRGKQELAAALDYESWLASVARPVEATA